MPDRPWRFNPRPRIEAMTFAGGASCLVVDDALADPHALRDYAIARRAEFAAAPTNAYPGIELPAEAGLEQALAEVFRLHVRPRLPVRRLVGLYARLAMVTLAPSQLQPRQTIPHRDSAWVDPAHAIAASVLYLFEDAALGGTGFYVPKRPRPEVEQLVHAASTLPAADFATRFDVPCAYPAESNAWFERVGIVAPRFNRLVFYDGRLFHSGDIPHPERLTDDPASGRLTLNGFFTCTRDAV